METSLIIVVVVVVLLGFCILATAFWLNIAETQRLRAELESRTRELATAYARGYEEGVTTSGSTLQTSVLAVSESMMKILTKEVVGEANVPVPQPEAPGVEPAWYEWEATDTVVDFGVGDSVYVEREAPDRVAGINEGESIIPGVPLPDMSGEKFDG